MGSHLQSTMAGAAPTYVSELVDQMKGLTDLVDEETLLGLAVEHVADGAAKKLALKQGNSMMQTAVYLLTKASILGSYELTKAALVGSVDLIGIGAGLAKIDMTGFAITQLRAEVAELARKMDVILGAPLKLAIQSLNMAMIKMENQDIKGTVQELHEVKRHAMKAFVYAEGQGKKKGNLKNGVFALQMKVCAEVLIQGYDKDENKITPFYLLADDRKKMISQLLEADVKNAKSFHNSQQAPWYALLNKEQKAQERQDALDALLRTCYPLISEGRGLTRPFAPVKMPYDLKVLPEFLPEGQNDASVVTVGQLEGRPHNVRVWREGDQVMADVGFRRLAASNNAEVTLRVTGPHFLIELRSRGGKETYWPGCLGLYRLHFPETGKVGQQGQARHTQGLVFRQLDGADRDHYLYRVGNPWWVNHKLGEEGCFLKAQAGEADQSFPPAKSWEYLNHGMTQSWHPEPSLECSREASTPCK